MSAQATAPTKTVELPHGCLAYSDEGEGPPVVFSHGLLVNSHIWDEVAERLVALGYRCIRPGLPMGAHTIPFEPGADLSPEGIATLLGDFLTAMEIDLATVVGNDSGGAIAQMLAARGPERIGRLILTNCDIGAAFPPFPYSLLPPIARLPRGTDLLSASMRLRLVRFLAFRPLTRRAIQADQIHAWVRPTLDDPAIRRDVSKLLTGVRGDELIEAERGLARVNRPVLFVWGRDDRFFKPVMVRRLAATLPDAQIEWIADAKTFVMIDQPEQVAARIANFLAR